MSTLATKKTETVRATNVAFAGDVLRVQLSDGREVRLPFKRVPWLKWLADATPKQRTRWSLEPGGFAVYWDELDDGIEVCHLLDAHPIATT